jgi:hypothetical protein
MRYRVGACAALLAAGCGSSECELHRKAGAAKTERARRELVAAADDRVRVDIEYAALRVKGGAGVEVLPRWTCPECAKRAEVYSLVQARATD